MRAPVAPLKGNHELGRNSTVLLQRHLTDDGAPAKPEKTRILTSKGRSVKPIAMPSSYLVTGCVGPTSST